MIQARHLLDVRAVRMDIEMRTGTKRALKRNTMAAVRRRLSKDDVVAVFVQSNGKMLEISADDPDRRLPKRGRLYSRMIGVGRVTCREETVAV